MGLNPEPSMATWSAKKRSIFGNVAEMPSANMYGLGVKSVVSGDMLLVLFGNAERHFQDMVTKYGLLLFFDTFMLVVQCWWINRFKVDIFAVQN